VAPVVACLDRRFFLWDARGGVPRVIPGGLALDLQRAHQRLQGRNHAASLVLWNPLDDVGKVRGAGGCNLPGDALPLVRELQSDRAAVVGIAIALDPAFGLELIDQAADRALLQLENISQFGLGTAVALR